ncbi:Cell division trigger factor [Lachnospiraceae bacterium TWA4]|nr:Cell division trigger factor [Lachnospiraceae bacterium TWA4]
MNKYFSISILCFCLIVVLLTGCKQSDTKKSDNQSATNSGVEQGNSSSSVDAKTAFNYDPDDYITLGEYKGLTFDKPIAEISEEDINSQIDSELQDVATKELVTNRAIKSGDSIIFDSTSTVDGKDSELGFNEDMTLTVGDAELGEEVDKKLIGASVGDTVTAKTVLDDYYEEDAGKEIIYKIKIKEIFVMNIPKVSDYVKTKGYESEEAYKEYLKTYLATEQSNNNTISNALNIIIKNSKFKGYPKDLHDYDLEQTKIFYQSFANMWGMSDSNISDEELEEAVTEDLQRYLVVRAISKKESIEVSDEAYTKYLNENYLENGYSSTEEYEEDYTKEAIIEVVRYDLVGEFLLKENTLHEISQEEFDKLYGDVEEVDPQETEVTEQETTKAN